LLLLILLLVSLLLLALQLEIVPLEMMEALMLLESLLLFKSPLFLLVAASAQLCELPVTVQNILLVENFFHAFLKEILYPVLCVSFL
jgi:hypothetical protein